MIITELEKKFDIKFKLKELNKLKDMGSLIATIESKLTN
jgi:acyl carrier protein